MSISPWVEVRNLASAIFVQPNDQTVAAPPYPPRRRGLADWLAGYRGMVRVMLTEYRSYWWIHVLFGLLMPLGMLFFLQATAGEVPRERAIFILGGNLATAVVYGPAMMIINKVGWGRHTRDFDYWASLPLHKLAVILAMVTVSLVFSFPGLVTLNLAGSRMFDLPLSAGLVLVPLIPLGAVSLVAPGALVATYAKDGPTANALANILMAFVTYLSPTMIPAEAFPAPIRWLSYLTPIPYVSDAFRLALSGKMGLDLAYHVAIVAVIGLGSLALVQRKLDWRS